MPALSDMLADTPTETPTPNGSAPQTLSQQLGESDAPNPTPAPTLSPIQNPHPAYAGQAPLVDQTQQAPPAQTLSQKLGAIPGEMMNEVPKPVQEHIVQPTLTALQMAGNAIETPHRAVKSFVNAAENQGNELDDKGQPQKNPFAAAWEGAIHPEKSASWADVILNQKGPSGESTFMPGFSDQERQSAAQKVSLLPEFVADPAMYLKVGGGLTQLGEKVSKGLEGETKGFGTQRLGVPISEELENTPKPMGSTLMQDYEKGYKAPLTLGNQAIIPGQPIAKAVRATGQTLSSLLDSGENLPLVGKGIGAFRTLSEKLGEGFNPMTSNPEFNALKQSEINKTNYQKLQTNLDTDENKRVIEDHALSAGISPDEMRQRILDYVEPRGSQEDAFAGRRDVTGEEKDINDAMIEGQRAKAAQLLSPDMKAYADEIRQMHEERAGVESQKGLLDTTRQNYIEHSQTPEAKEFLDKTFNNDEQQQLAAQLEKVKNPNNATREKPYTVNEMNNLFAEGKGHTIPELGQWPQFKNFKGKFFNDQVEELAADRYLKSVKAENEHDFLQSAGKTYGKSEEYIKANENPKDWVKVSKPSFDGVAGSKENTLWFPKEIGRYLNRTEQLTTGKYIEPILNVFRGLNNFTKKMNFGVWPGSAVKIELGNQKLAFLSDLWSPHSQWVGHGIATKIRQGGMEALDDTRPIINSPTLGALTEKQVYQLAMEHRGIGMGLAQAELKSMRPESQGLGIAKAGWALHNYVEDGTRMGTFVDALKQGYTAKAAGEATQKALYDYSKLGPIPDTLRQFMPFFTFAYKNGPAMVGKLATNPGKMALYDRARQVLNQPVKDQNQYESEWQSDNMPVYMGTGKDGKNYYLYGNKFMPETDMNEWMGSGKTFGEALENTPAKMARYAIGMQNPYLKTFVEENAGKKGHSFYFDQDIQRMKGEKQATGLGFNTDAKTSYAIRNTVRLPSEMGKASDETIPPELRAAHFLLGLNIQAVDPTVQEMNYYRNLEQQLKGSGGHFGGEADVHYYSSLLAHYLATDDKAKAALAQENLDTAMKNLEETESQVGK